MRGIKNRIINWISERPTLVVLICIPLLPLSILGDKIKKMAALRGLSLEQEALLKRIVKKQSALNSIGRGLSDDEDYTRANMLSSSFGTEVLARQVEREKQEKEEIKKLIAEARQAGISEKKIRLVVDENF
ncbi:hypothetical protein A2Y83_03140 [Candidatus Falkowbacteria bacterium RBG_13_39_14]|uniref:Uncharacterized protein n=1 Tax=Candidatus Falkowbacteria bacterium RBG_13_39_14 TaxID=1797985 RepID=A0A1F5S8C6_9BACT|nr:MAG: hypothetical protein A2Y83_03140 [Candidatus Falkowbacteria bacterium RBG_13_39_14]